MALAFPRSMTALQPFVSRIFLNRTDAGRRLADLLLRYRRHPDVVVLALPRGGVPVAYEVAKALEAPFDTFTVRKLGVPGHEELAMGAIASGGVRVLNEDVVRTLNVPPSTIERVSAREEKELKRREHFYRGDRPVLELRGKIVILVDDGLATGSSMRAAVIAVRTQSPVRLIVAVPVAADSAYREFEATVDEVVSVIVPENFYGVGEWYEDFAQTSDDEVRRLLNGPPLYFSGKNR